MQKSLTNGEMLVYEDCLNIWNAKRRLTWFSFLDAVYKIMTNTVAPSLRGGNVRHCPATQGRDCAPLSRHVGTGMCATVPPRRDGNVRHCPATQGRDCAPLSRHAGTGMCATVPPRRDGNVRHCPATQGRECAPLSRHAGTGMCATVPPRRGGATMLFVFYGTHRETQTRRTRWN